MLEPTFDFVYLVVGNQPIIKMLLFKYVPLLQSHNHFVPQMCTFLLNDASRDTGMVYWFLR